MKPVRGGLGFTVAGGVNTGGCYIKDIITDPALSDGRLMKGDKIISVSASEDAQKILNEGLINDGRCVNRSVMHYCG